MKDIQKIKEFFSQPLNEESTTFKVGDKVTYLGHPAEITAVNKEMTGAITYNVSYDKGTGKTKVSNINNKGGEIKSLEEIDINDPVLMKARAAAFQRTQPKPEPVKTTNSDYKAIKNADKIKALKIRRAQLMRDMEQEAEPEGGPIADRYGSELNKIDKAIAMLSEAKRDIDKIKKQLDALGVKYEMSATDKVRPFKVIYKPVNKSDEFYDKFEDIVDLFNLKSFVKSSMNESKEESLYKNWDQFEKPSKIKVYLNNGKTLEITPLKLKGGKRVYDAILQAFIDDRFDITNKVIQGMTNNLSEAKEEDIIDTITMDIPLFLRMLEYSREDAKKDLDLHDVTEKANKLGKERGILSMDDYEEIVGAAEDIKEAELTEAYVPSNIKEFAKRKGVSALVNKVAGWAERVGKRITGGTAIGYNYSTLVLDMEYQGSEIRINTDNDTVTLYDEPVNSFAQFKRVYDENNETSGNNLEERISEALNKINEELCPAGKAYIKKRKAAGEKSSAYLSGRAVKVCKGQMSGKAKKKTNESLVNEGQKINQNLDNLLNKIKKDFNIDNE